MELSAAFFLMCFFLFSVGDVNSIQPDFRHVDNRIPIVHSTSSNSDNPCPNATAIAPCVCLQDEIEYDSYNIDCSNAQNNDELERAFKADFPQKNYFRFNIAQVDPSNITEIGDILNGVTFTKIYLQAETIEKISPKFLLDCANTLDTIGIFRSKMNSTGFPFEVLPQLTSLIDLYVFNSPALTEIPLIGSESLKSVSFEHNPNLTTISPDAFKNAPNIHYMSFQSSDLEHIPNKSFNVASGNTTYVYLGGNEDLDVISADMFVFPEEVANGTRLLIEAYGLEKLTMLEEKDYKPLFDGTACNTKLATDVYAKIHCNCTMRWAFDQCNAATRYNEHIAALCTDGRGVNYLNAEEFKKMCDH